jgi:hypothetical protein
MVAMVRFSALRIAGFIFRACVHIFDFVKQGQTIRLRARHSINMSISMSIHSNKFVFRIMDYLHIDFFMLDFPA